MTYATAKYRGVRGKKRPRFDPRNPIECAGPHLTAQSAADLVSIHDRKCQVETWQPRCQDCLDEGPPFGLFQCDGCEHEHETGGRPNADLILRGRRLCVACATAMSLADPRFWITRAAQLTDERYQLGAYVDYVGVLGTSKAVLENWWLDPSTNCVLMPSTCGLILPDPSGPTLRFGALCELVHRQAARALEKWPKVAWAVTAVFDDWQVWSLLGASEDG
jgi:hypothetical protein